MSVSFRNEGETERYNHSGDYSRKEPPVPIPNTEVKLSYAESTCRDTDREDRASPLFNFKPYKFFAYTVFSFYGTEDRQGE